jgi:hypothetical protein
MKICVYLLLISDTLIIFIRYNKLMTSPLLITASRCEVTFKKNLIVILKYIIVSKLSPLPRPARQILFWLISGRFSIRPKSVEIDQISKSGPNRISPFGKYQWICGTMHWFGLLVAIVTNMINGVRPKFLCGQGYVEVRGKGVSTKECWPSLPKEESHRTVLPPRVVLF